MRSFTKSQTIIKCRSNEKSLFFIHSQLSDLWKCCMVQHFNEQTKKIFSKQKQAIKIISMTDIYRNLNSDKKNETFTYSKYL